MDEITGTIIDGMGEWLITARLVNPARPVSKRPARRRYPKRTRAMLLEMQGHRCSICGGPLGLLDSHVDHVIPLIEGGEDTLSNCSLTHQSCNLRKGRRLVVGQGAMPWA